MRDELLAAPCPTTTSTTAPGGANPTFGELLQEWCTVEESYVESLKSFDQTWEREAPAAELNALGSRFYQARAELLREVVAAFSDDDLAKPVRRPGGFYLPVDMQLDACRRRCSSRPARRPSTSRRWTGPAARDA